jgi:pimeloyl-ACP methyl ester carboxylesterase
VARDFTFTTELLVDNVARLISALSSDPVHVVGAKSGGLITIELAALRPHLVRTITLASTPLAPPEPQNCSSTWSSMHAKLGTHDDAAASRQQNAAARY